jgi:hypothetical protein
MTLGRGPCSDTNRENKKPRREPLCQHIKTVATYLSRNDKSMDLKSAAYLIQQMDGLNDILWEDQEEVGNISRQCEECMWERRWKLLRHLS